MVPNSATSKPAFCGNVSLRYLHVILFIPIPPTGIHSGAMLMTVCSLNFLFSLMCTDPQLIHKFHLGEFPEIWFLPFGSASSHMQAEISTLVEIPAANFQLVPADHLGFRKEQWMCLCSGPKAILKYREVSRK